MIYDKIDPALAAAFDDFKRRGRASLVNHAGVLGLVSTAPVPKPARVVVFVDCDEAASFEHLAGDGGRGVTLNQAEGRIRTGIVALDSLERLSEQDSVHRIVPARPLRLHMDVAPAKVDLPAFRNRSGLTGQGVVVGIVDSGIESTHPAFAGRILRLWDQTLPGPGVPEGSYGAELTGELLQVSQDKVGHGTHVSGIAVGSDETYGGVAPGADLVVVKTDLLDAHVADGVRYAFRVAAELNRPAVVNLSLGGQADAHDGTDPMSAVIDAQAGPGRIVCCSAGNEGTDNVHAQVRVGEGRTRRVSCSMATWSPGGVAPVAVLNGWYAGDDAMAVAVVAPSGKQTPFQAVATDESPVRTYQFPEGSIRVTTPGIDPANGDHNFLVEILPAPSATGVAPGTAASPPGSWGLRLRGDHVTTDGRVDMWSVDPTAAQFTGKAVHDALKIGSPGVASRAVTVASYTTKVEWFDVMGHPHEVGLELDDISAFSSEGPRRDGVDKPDVAAPGAMIASSMSVNSGVPIDDLVDDRNTVKAGTSMASPFVAGVVALLLERDPALDPEGVKALLRAHCAIPGKPAAGFDPKWGYGLLDTGGL